MRPRITTVLTALALTTIAAPSAFAQNGPPTGRAANDGGMLAAPSETQVPQYNSAGAVIGGPENEMGSNNCAARFRSFDPASGTYRGSDGRRHPCP
jgi:BA14K-like protein